jgi:hypothetical protein
MQVRAPSKLGPLGSPNPTETEQVRSALQGHITSVLFNPSHPAGSAFREAVLGHRSPSDIEAAKREMLSVAGGWSSDDPSWERHQGEDDTVVYSGRLWQLYTEVKLHPGAPPQVYVEID